MKTLPISQQQKVQSYSLILDEFKGTATVLDDVIAGKEYAKEATNLIQVQDGRWSGRPGRDYYGTAMPEPFLGAEQFVKADGTREIIAIGATTGKAYRSQDGSAWTEVTGATFDITAKNLFFKQINNYLFICNGSDRLTRYNGTVLSRYTTILAPTGLTGSRGAGLTTGSLNNFYKVTALNDIGETVGSNEYSIPTNKLRDTWNAASNEYIDLTWNVVSGAIKYQVYYADVSGKEELLTESTTNSYRDDNTWTPNPYAVVPDQDSTGAPKFSMIATSDSRIWGIAPSEYKWRVFASGTGQYLGNFGSSFGGAWKDLDPGSAEEVAFIEHFHSGKGEAAVTIFTKDPRGGGSVWQMNLVPTDFAGTSVLVPYSEKIVGSVGTNSPGAALLVGDSIMFLSAYGAITLSNKENVVNVLSTTEQSRLIQPSYLGLNFAKSNQFRGYKYRNWVLFSATEGDGENDLIFIKDTALDRWYWKWNFGVRQFFEYTDNSGKTYFLYVPTSGNQLVQISENIKGDFGSPIPTSLLTGLIPIDKDKYVFATVDEALIDLGRPKGTINFEVLGTERKKGFQSVASKQITDTNQVNEFWSGDLGEITLKDEEDAPKTYSQASVRKRKRVGKTINNIQFHVYSNDLETQYTVLSMQARGTIRPVRPPSTWN